MLTAADVMTTTVITVQPHTTVQEIARLLQESRISGVPVVDEAGRILGIVSEGDLITHTGAIGEQRRSWWLTLISAENSMARDYARTHGRTARDVMTTPVVSVNETTPLVEIAKLLERRGIKRVPVVRGETLVGIVSRSNLLQALASANVSKPASIEDRAIRDRLTEELRAQPWAHLLTKNIVVEDGVVHFFGFVRNEDERRALRVAAENTPGVQRVEDQMIRREVGIAE